MTTIPLYSEDFTGEIRHAVDGHGNQINEITTVGGWTPFWREEPDAVLYRPEMRVIDASNPNYLEPVMRLNDAGRGLTVFKLYSRHDAGYFKQYVIRDGLSTLEIGAYGHAWYSQRDNARVSEYKDEDGKWYPIYPSQPGVTLRVGVDGQGGLDPWSDTIQWGFASHYDTHGGVWCMVSNPGPLLTVFIRSTVDDPFKHADVYWASVQLTGYTNEPKPEPAPTGWTIGREQYKRTYVLMPPGCGKQWPQAAIAATWDTHRFTVGGSADDAGIGPEDRIVLAVNPGGWPSSLSAFYVTHYPGIEYVSLGAQSPEDLELVLEDYIHGGVTPVPEPEPDPLPEPPDPPDPPPPVTGVGFDNLPKALSAGLHFTAGPPGRLPSGSPAVELPDTSRRYIGEGKPSIVKGVSGGDVYRVGKYARQFSPGTRTVWRRVVGDGNYITGNLRDQAQRYLDQYKAEAEAASRNLGITLDEFWNHIDYISGLNELISNWGGNTDTQVEFECNLADLVDSQIKHGTKATMLAVAIGNPSHEPADILRMLPAAQMSAEHGHVLDYHAYWTAGHEPDRSYLDAHWKWHAGRWAEWDKVFVAAGVAPLYMFGEGGMVYDPNAGGTWLGSGRAWRDAGSILYFLNQIKRQNVHIRDWNATHGNRCLGGVLFTCEYSWGWDEFLLGTGELLEILAWMRTL